MGNYTCGAKGYVLLSQELFDVFVSELDDAGVVIAIRQYFTEGSRTLGEWISAEGSRQGRSWWGLSVRRALPRPPRSGAYIACSPGEQGKHRGRRK